MVTSGHTPKDSEKQNTRLSQSGLWEHQRRYYHENGVAAWSSGAVPHYITNNPVIARAYADLILGQLEDLARSGVLALDRPLYVVEMGGGSGRLAYYILRSLEEMRELLPVEVCYVLSDFTETNLAYWRSHPCLAPYFESGKLDLALFDVEKDTSLKLEISGVDVNGEQNPLVFVANYLFDTLTQDSFRIWKGELQDALAEMREGQVSDGLGYSYVPSGAAPYGREDYDRILREYTARLGDTCFLFPVGPLSCLQNLLEIARDRLFLITADKAWTRWEELVGLSEPVPMAHGASFSMTVNFHAMSMWWEDRGGSVFHTSPRDSMLQISCFCFGLPERALVRTGRAFADSVDGFGPLDFFNLRGALQEAVENRNLRLCLEFLRLSRWDPEVFFETADGLLGLLDEVPTLHKRELIVALARVWQNYFPIGESKDIPFEIARVLFRLDCFEQSLHFYGESLRLLGEHKMTYHNMGLCLYNLRRLAEAREMFERALELDRDYGVSREWLLRLAPELEEAGALWGSTAA